ncbi:MAG: glycoside hydrolase family 2 protein [Acutalibacteraceae bacterium]|jgi:hypothetical protein
MLTKTCLNGLWDFSCKTDSLEHLPTEWSDVSIKVPCPFNVNSFSHGYPKNTAGDHYYVSGADFRLYPEYPLEWDNAQIGFYRRKFFVGEESRGRRIFLHFDAVAYKSVYYVNGKHVADEDEAFLPLEMEITDAVKFGAENELLVGCQTARSAKYKDENNRDRTDLPEGSFWGGHIGGIWQDCWLVERAPAFVADVFAYADVYKNNLHIEYQSVDAKGKQVRFSLSRHGAEDYKEMFTVACDDQPIDWDYSDWNIALWEPESPNLYDLKAEVMENGEAIDAHVVRIGFRTFHIQDKRFVLNGRPIKLKNDSWHYMGYAIQTEEYARAYFKMAKQANVNIIRLHAMPYPGFFFDIADEVGMLMVSESATWASHCCFSYNPTFFENSKKHLRRLIRRDRNHPSVVMWSPENECIPAFKVVGSKYIKDIEDLSEKLYDMTQEIPKLDPSRPYSCDGSHDLGGRLDVNSLHYPGYDCPTHREKPITIGENGSMYYSTPDSVCLMDGEKTLQTFDGRLWAVGGECYRNLIGQRKWADQVCVFNLIWYGLEPLPFKDRLLTYDDYTTPGIKPSRITPYLRTLNAGAQDDLPEFIPNPVWKLTQKAFTPVRPFLERTPTSVWGGKEVSFPVCVFNDNRDPLNLTLTGTLKVDGKTVACVSKQMYMDACTYEDTELTLTMPEVCCEKQARLEVSLSDASKNYYTDTADIRVFNQQKLQADWEAVKLPCLRGDDQLDDKVAALDFRQGEQSPYGTFTRHRSVQAIFTSDSLADELRVDGKDILFNAARGARYFEEYLNFNATPLYFNGVGMPLALDLTVAGQPRIACTVDLPAYAEEEPLALVMMIKLAKYLAKRTVKAPAEAIFYGDPNGAVAAMLGEIRAQYKTVDKDALIAMLPHKQNALLIVDGSADLGWLKGISACNFENVLIVGLKKAPDLFFYDFEVSRKSTCHVAPVGTDPVIAGLYSNNLYGLTEGSQAQIGVDLLEYKHENDNVLLGLPAVDWRQWNQNAEYLKTVSVHKSELEDRRRFAALSRHDYAGSAIYFCQMSMQLQNKKIKHMLVRFLSALGTGIEFAKNAALEELLTSGIYGATLNRALCKSIKADEDVLALRPGLNRVENGEAWKAVSRESGLPGKYAMTVFVYSPSDRTDLLLNPDTVELVVTAERGCELILNGEKIGEGEQIKINSITLTSGWNTLTLVCRNGGAMPDLKFTRYDLSKLDLRFSLYGHDVQLVGLTGATLYSENRPDTTNKAIAGKEEFWISDGEQREGIDFDIQLENTSSVKALYFSCVTSDIAGASYTPKQFDLLAGDSADDLKVVYSAMFEDRMSYNGGKVFVDLGEGVTARCFKIALKTNALKPLVISGLSLLS